MTATLTKGILLSRLQLHHPALRHVFIPRLPRNRHGDSQIIRQGKLRHRLKIPEPIFQFPLRLWVDDMTFTLQLTPRFIINIMPPTGRLWVMHPKKFQELVRFPFLLHQHLRHLKQRPRQIVIGKRETQSIRPIHAPRSPWVGKADEGVLDEGTIWVCETYDIERLQGVKACEIVDSMGGGDDAGEEGGGCGCGRGGKQGGGTVPWHDGCCVLMICLYSSVCV